MKNELIALPVYQDRISPLFDVAKKFVVYEVEDKVIKQKITIDVQPENELLRIERLKEIGVSAIICGAVSEHLSRIVTQKGIKLTSWSSGLVDEVIELYLKDMLKPIGLTGSVCKPGRKMRRCSGRRNGIFNNRNNPVGDIK